MSERIQSGTPRVGASFERPEQHGADEFGARLSSAREEPTLIAADYVNEGLFCNVSHNHDQPEDVIVFRDRYENGKPVGVEGTRVAAGECGRGDAVMIDSNNNNRFDTRDRVYKVPNQKFDEHWLIRGTHDARAPIGSQNSVRVESSGPLADAIRNAAELRTIGQTYGDMSLDHFFDLMGKKPIYVDGQRLK